ncbi:MAG: metallophosphoesterase [bacterium]
MSPVSISFFTMPRASKIIALAAASVALSLPATALGASERSNPEVGVVAAYTLVVPKSVATTNLQVRAVIPNGVPCPGLRMTTKAGVKLVRKMTKRVPGATTGAAFASLRACQANIPVTDTPVVAGRVGSDGVPARLPKRFDRIAMFGDSGCRIDDDIDPTAIDVQDCSDPVAWPLAANSRSIAREKPDMSIFTGDFFYREDPCPVGYEALGGGSPPPDPSATFNDTDYGWMADTLIPMAPLFRAAPILAIRGNHEQCDRGGNGWFLFFDAGSSLGPDACAPATLGGPTTPNISDTWHFDAPIGKGRTLRLVAVDSAYGKNFEISSWVTTQRTAYEQAAVQSAPKQGRESWLLAHRPMFGVEPNTQPPPGVNQWTAIDQTAAGYGLIDNYNLLVGSHVHVSQIVKIPGQPPQLVEGNGGSKPDDPNLANYTLPAYGPLADASGAPLSPDYTPYATASYLYTAVDYGYNVMIPGKKIGRWTLQQKTFRGQQFDTCSLVAESLTCAVQ